jgi:hypothetical protein
MVDDTQFELLQSEMEKGFTSLEGGCTLMLRNGNSPHPTHAREPAFVGLLLYIEYQKFHTFTFVKEYSISMGIASF